MGGTGDAISRSRDNVLAIGRISSIPHRSSSMSVANRPLRVRGEDVQSGGWASLDPAGSFLRQAETDDNAKSCLDERFDGAVKCSQRWHSEINVDNCALTGPDRITMSTKPRPLIYLRTWVS